MSSKHPQKQDPADHRPKNKGIDHAQVVLMVDSIEVFTGSGIVGTGDLAGGIAPVILQLGVLTEVLDVSLHRCD